MGNLKLVINSIIGESIDGYSRVTLGNEVFNAVRGNVPQLEYETKSSDTGELMRVFRIEGVEVFSVYSRAERKTAFYVTTKVAKEKAPRVSGEAPFKLSRMSREFLTADEIAEEATTEDFAK